MFSNVIEHVRQKIQEAKIETFPYTYIEVDNIWPEDFYQELLDKKIPSDCLFSLKELSRVENDVKRLVLELSGKNTILTKNIRPFWENIYKFLYNDIGKLLLEKFNINEHIQKYEILYTRDSKGYLILPHTDRYDKVLTALFYLPENNIDTNLGTVILTPKIEGFTNSGDQQFPFSDFDVYKTIPYVRNKLFCFVKSNCSFHGVLPIEHEIERNLLIYDIQRKC